MMVEEAEIQRRNRYWAEHWQDFSCEVVVQTPKTANAHVGLFGGHLFGSLPVPVHTMDVDRGTFYFRDGCMCVDGGMRTYVWPIQGTWVTYYEGRVEIRQDNRPVITLLGPVTAPILGAYHAFGYPIN